MRRSRFSSSSWIVRFAALASAIFSVASPNLAWAKKVSVEWKPIKGARSYELQIRAVSSNKVQTGKVIAAKKLEDTSWSGDVPFGVYEYRIRAYDRISRAGQWSAPHALAVMPEAPEAATPSPGGEVTLYHPNATTHLKWKSVDGVERYRVKLTDGQGKVVFNSTVQGTDVRLKALPAGKYEWQVSCVLNAKGRSLASGFTKDWVGKPSSGFEFEVNQKTLSAPVLVSPLEAIPPADDGRVRLRWDRVSGAEAYEVRIFEFNPGRTGRDLASDSSRVHVYTTPQNEFTLRMRKEGNYRWAVRALANYENKAPEAASQQSVGDFKLDRNAAFIEGHGYLAFSTMIAPYNYEITNASGHGSTDSSALTLRLSGEYYFHPNWGIGAGIQDAMLQISGASFSRKDLELNLKYRMNLSSGPYGWLLAPKIGLERREYVEVYYPQGNNVGLTQNTIGAMGLAVGFDLRKQFSRAFSLGAKFSYFSPMSLSGIPSGSEKTSDASSRNMSIGLQGLYWLGPRWGLGAGAFIEKRSISFTIPKTGSGTSGNSTSVEQIYMDATYFFASLIYTFK